MRTQNNLAVPSPGHYLFWAVVAIMGITLIPGTATAMTYWQAVRSNAAIVIDTALGNLTAQQELDLISANWDDYYRQKHEAGLTAVGQVAIDGVYPVTVYTTGDLGSTERLTYFFNDPRSGQRTTPLFEVSHVEYWALLDPSVLHPNPPTEALIRAHLVPLGDSNDVATDFAVPFTLQGFEPIIVAFPYDATGGEITGEGTAGFSSHVLMDNGQSCFDVSCGRSMVELGSPEAPAIPADFFGPGSDPFEGVIQFDGANPTGPDTIVNRLAPLNLPDPAPSTTTIPIEIIELSLVSCAPITVTFNGGRNPERWDVEVELSPTPAPVGQMTITRTHDNGGTFTSDFPVQPLYTFTKVGDPCTVHVLDTGIEGLPPLHLHNTVPNRWESTSPKPNPPCDGDGFYPVGPMPLVVQSGGMLLELYPPEPGRAFIALSTAEQWQRAMAKGTVRSLFPPSAWDDYMQQWNDPQNEREGKPYPANTYLEAELSVWPGTCCPDDQLPSPGLVMAWGDRAQLTEGESYSSAWMFQYPADPDLTNVAITITVFPPCGMSAVSFGMKDINGFIRGWYWNVAAAPGPGTLQCGVGTTININTALTGIGATTPTAISFLNNPSFDITQVVELIFDENNIWVAGTSVPPPGSTVPRPWNYWRALIITPNDDPSNKPAGPVKWSQPPVELGPAIFLGWDEVSVDSNPPLMADDWKCEDPRPVTDIHWWGSFLEWDNPDPPILPTAFHIGIWTDVPKDAANPFSHPGEMVWEHTCTNYLWNFAGYDKDPRNSTTPLVHDSCFQFNCDLPTSEWFYQKPMINGQGRVYWLSIAAVYPAGTTPQYPWGWKTRPHFFNDDAVRIFGTVDGTWPPVVGSKYNNGEPIEFPEKVSWDLAFELTTNEPEPVEPNTDLNLDGVTDFNDVVFTARKWLLVWP